MLYTESIPEENIGQHWDLMKSTIKSLLTQTIATEINKQRADKIKTLAQAMENIKATDHGPLDLQFLEEELEELLEEELEELMQHTYKGAHIRSRLDLVQLETTSKQNLAVEQNIQRGKQIKEMI